MNEIKLDVQVRAETGTQKIKGLRKENFIPAVVYGEQKKPTNVKVSRSAYEKIMRGHHGQSVLFHLNVMEDGKKLRDYSAIVREEQHDPVHDDLLHIDFLRISLKEEIEVKAPIIIRGEAHGVKVEGGSLDQPIHELEIICLPTNIPEGIQVHVDELSIGDAIHVSDLKLPEGVKTEIDPESVVVSCVPPMKEEEEVPEGEGLEEPEVIGEKKEGEEGEAAEEASAEEKDEKPKEEKKEE